MNTYQKYLSLGLSVIPCENKISKLSWKHYQNKKASVAEAEVWAGDVAVICGEVSGGLVCIDFDVKYGNRFDEWVEILNSGNPEILSKLVIESTPSGGKHVIFRSDKKIGNIKLANNKQNQVMIETRGEGGYFVCAPSRGYEFYYSAIENINKLSFDETDILLSAAISLNENVKESQQSGEQKAKNGTTPFDDYDSRNDPVGLLEACGWRVVYRRGNSVYLLRPGKERGVSATWNVIPDRFYVFSTSTPFENERIYKASAVYAVLNHNGDWSAAARSLVSQGYGKRDETEKQSILVDDRNIKQRMYEIQVIGYKRGISTGWKNLDKYYTVVKRQFTVVVGMPSHGKSQFVDAMMINLARENNWRFAVFSPENYPFEMHYHQLIEKIVGKSFWKIEKDVLSKTVDYIADHFYFIDAAESDVTLDLILDQTERLVKDKKIDALDIDPWNEIELSRPKDISDSDFIGNCLRKCRKFTRRNNIHLWIVTHPTKMVKDKNGKYPVPELYDCAGSAMWRNKADNGICVYRNFDNDITDIHIQKIKYRYTGKMGSCRMTFNATNGRYEEADDDNVSQVWG